MSETERIIEIIEEIGGYGAPNLVYLITNEDN